MGKIKDLTGQKFGKLTVLEITNERRNRQVVWKCQCECGNITYVVGQALRTGHTTTCGCGHYNSKNAKQLEGMKFSKLTVLNRVGTDARKNATWDCICECGKHRICTSNQLLKMETRSCIDCIDYSSKGEQVIAELLTKHHINFIREYIFKDLISDNGIPFRFDFAIVNNEGQVLQLIEYDGSQHFKPSEQFGGIEEFKKRQKYDKIKNEYCIKNNIPLKRINKDYRHLKIEDIIL